MHYSSLDLHSRPLYREPDCVCTELEEEDILCESLTGESFDDPDDKSGSFNWN